MVKTKVQWTSSTGQQFLFEYEVKKNPETSSVKDVSGKIYHVVTNNNSMAGATEKNTSTSPKKKQKGEEVVGYLSGYELKRGDRGNKRFHIDADCVSGELQKIACSLYDSRGILCRAPRDSAITNILPMDGSMFLLEMIEIKSQFSGMDLGINFLHEYLSQATVRKRVGVVVMYPWTLNGGVLRYEDNVQHLKESVEGKSESEKVDVYRSNTVRLRRQYSRMGFKAVADTPDWVDSWFISMQKYKTVEPAAAIKSSWLSKEEARQLHVPMPVKKHVESNEDKELKQLLQDITPDYDPYGGQYTSGVREQIEGLQQQLSSLSDFVSTLTGGATLPSLQSIQGNVNRMSNLYPNGRSKLTDEKKLDIKRLVDAGANLHGINALHLAAASYKDDDLFDLLIDGYGMSVEEFDHIGRKPIHVAAIGQNADAVRVLIAKGADKNGKNKEGKTALEELNEDERNLGDFGAIFGSAAMGGGPGLSQVRSLLI
mmetsp:Transcript_33752/g.62124  ORF Transcript_33752/g.62124 Transcript_33752/m.62124 type:complete len:485 (+) Transcript_33752:69-1523(+)